MAMFDNLFAGSMGPMPVQSYPDMFAQHLGNVADYWAAQHPRDIAMGFVGATGPAKSLNATLKASARHGKIEIPWGNNPLKPNIEVLLNPTKKQAEQLARQTKYGELRIIKDPNKRDFYAFDAERGTHYGLAELLGLRWDDLLERGNQIFGQTVKPSHPIFSKKGMFR